MRSSTLAFSMLLLFSTSLAFAQRQKIRSEADNDDWWAQRAAAFFPKYQFTLQATSLPFVRSGSDKIGAPDAILAIFTWDGGDATLNNWSAGNNWNPNGAPPLASGANDFIFTDASLRASPNFEASYTINSLTFGSGGGAFSFTGSGGAQTLTINSGITNSSGSAQSFASTLENINLGASQTWDAGSAAGGSMTFASAVGLGASRTLTIDGANNVTITGIVSGTGTSGITKNGAGTLTLSGANTYDGNTLLNAGTLRATTSANALGDTGTLTLAGGTLELANNTGLNFGRNTTVSGSMTIESDRTSVGAGVTHTLGTLSIGAQTLTIDKGSFVTSGTAGVTFSGATTLSASGAVFDVATGASLTLAAVTGAGNNFTVQGVGNTTITGNITTGAGTLTKNGAGTLTLSGPANAYTGLTTINGGVVNIDDATSLGTTANGTTVASGATLQIQSGITVGAEALTINGTGASGQNGALVNVSETNNYGGLLTLGSASTISSDSDILNLTNAGTITGSGFGLTLTGAGAGSITSIIGTGSGGLTKNGAGTWTLSGANTYGGGTTINSGLVTLGNASALGSGGLTMNGGTLELNGNSIALANLSGSGGTIQQTNPSTVTTLTVGSDNTSTTYSGILDDSNGSRSLNLTKTGTGTLTLSGANTNNNANGTGTIINGGVLRLNNATALATTLLTINGGVLELQNPTSFTRTLGAAGGNVRITGGTSGFSAFGSTATINLNNNSSTVQWGSATFAPTTLVLNDTTATAALIFQNGLDLNGATRTINVNANAATINGAIVNNGGGAAGLTKGGAGTLTLTGTNTYTGTTTVAGGGGQLFINGNSSAATGLVNVNSGGTTLGGSGTIGGAVTVASGSNLSPGATGIGSTAVLGTGALTLNSGSFFNVDLNNTTVGTGYDQVSVTGTVSVSGSNLVVTAGGGLSLGNEFFIIVNDGIDPITSTFAQGATVTSGSYIFAINYVDDFGGGLAGNDISLTLTAVPEPSTWISGALVVGLIGWSLLKNRRRNSEQRSEV